MTTPVIILFVAPAAYPLGGVQTWLDYLLPALREHKWNPVLGLVSGRHHDVDGYIKVHPAHEHVVIENPTGSSAGRIQSLVNVIRRVKPQMVVSVNICDCYAAVEMMRANGEASPHVVMADHSLDADFLRDAKKWRHVIDGFIGTNRLTVRLAHDYGGIAEQRIHYAPYGVPLTPYESSDSKGGEGPLRIAYSGRVDKAQKRAQDIPYILSTLEKFNIDYIFRLAGGGPYLAELQDQLQPMVKRGCVEFLGVLDAAALDTEIYDWAQALLVTSIWETGPLVIWEAMARGLPVVTSRYIGAGAEASLIHNVNCLMFPTGDTKAAARELQRVTDSTLRSTLALAGYALIVNRYTIEKSVEAWNGCLKKIIGAQILSYNGIRETNLPAGRLDRWFGSETGEYIRRLLGFAHQHESPGSEWPHVAQGLSKQHEDQYWVEAALADRP